MSIATLTSKGQLTVPLEVRDVLGLAPGDRLLFEYEADGSYRVRPVRSSIRSLRGIVPKPHRVVTLDDMDAAIAAGAASGR